MPGPVIQGHARLENACQNCHVRFDRSAQARLCMDCHKPVATDIRAGTGYHGRIKEQPCRSCHTDHKGRAAKIVQLDKAKFNHAQTDFQLRGKHRDPACASCHRDKTKYSQTPTDCASCHRKDDKHKNGLGQKCVNCHNENSWKETRFDHASTKFPLRLSHSESRVACTDCHINNKFADTSRECIACHRHDDVHKGLFGSRCTSCHNEGEWKAESFRHDRDTHFPLLDSHRTVKCSSCHRTPLYKEKTATRCIACHRGNDNEKGHKGDYGDKCEACHNAKRFKPSIFDHGRDTPLSLIGKHAKIKCDTCHRGPLYRTKTDGRCYACHKKEDVHFGSFDLECDKCHVADDWRKVKKVDTSPPAGNPALLPNSAHSP